MSSLIEKTYNVGHRQEPPQKKQKTEKTDDFEDQDTPTFSGTRGRGGELGDYVTKKRQEGLNDPNTAPATVVDLTQGCSFAISAICLCD